MAVYQKIIPAAGIAYPYYKQGQGLPAPVFGADVYSSALIGLMRTNQRSRVKRPTLGMKLLSYVFENTGAVLESLITREIVRQVAANIPQITIGGVTVNENNTHVTVNVFYSVQGVPFQTGPIPYGRA